MGLTPAERASRYRLRQPDAGLANVTLLVPAAAHADLQLIAEALCVDADLRPGPLRHGWSGRLVSAKTALRAGRGLHK